MDFSRGLAMKENKKEYSVYCHVSPSNKKYVGISCNPKKRWNNGKGYIKNYLFWRAIEKYGWDNFEHQILYSNLTVEEAKTIEIKLIEKWQLTNPQYGYNLRAGGDGTFSEHSRQLMSQSRKGNKNSLGKSCPLERRKRISDSLKQYFSTHPSPMLGKHHTLETKKKLRARIITEETRAKMRTNHADVRGAKNPSAKAIKQFDLNGNFLEEYAYATLAAKKYQIDLSSIIKCCKGKQKTCGGYKWAYANEV